MDFKEVRLREYTTDNHSAGNRLHVRTWKCVEKRTLTKLSAAAAAPWPLTTRLLLALAQAGVVWHASHAGMAELPALAVGI